MTLTITRPLNAIKDFLLKAIFSLTLLIGFCVSSRGQTKQPSITAYSVDFLIETFTGIPCDDFAKQFHGRIDTSVSYSKDSLEVIRGFLTKIKYSKHPWGIDTRAKLAVVDASGNLTDICMGIHRIYVNGRMIDDYPRFYNYLYSLISKKQAKMLIRK